jgi:hypothetical protein
VNLPGRPSHDKTSGIAPLTRERIEKVLDDHQWVYHLDSDGDPSGFWDQNVFYFLRQGPQDQILHVRGRWHQPMPIEVRPQLLLSLDDWHLTRIFPKGYTRVDDDGRVWVHTEHSVDWEFGVTDAQLAVTIECAILTSLALFRHLAEAFPITVQTPYE